ncbi:MAG: endolytic transglycosylase MltG [Candidatus Brocadiales bacterium]|nr:endolytic transglycosylase MltG [Candidatus Brocadiales bacterium]
MGYSNVVEKKCFFKARSLNCLRVFNQNCCVAAAKRKIYGIYENFNGNLRKKHLQKKTPYNTYRINGLPIGPISNPGVSSIKAVLNPAEHKAIYFVSKNNGTHVFTSTYREHLKAVRKYQKSRRYRSGRSWRNLKKKRVN